MSEIFKNTNSKITINGQLAIELENVKLTLPSLSGEVQILRGINLAVKNGESIGVVGPSGGGKSSMMMAIAGLERVTSGKVITAGFDLSNYNEDKLAKFRRDNVGIVFQNFHLIPTMTAIENISIPMEFAGFVDHHDRARKLLKKVDLENRAYHYPAQLSGGEQQRVALARAFATRPAILLADEPTGNLDQKTGKNVMDLIFELHSDSNTTMLLISHDPILANRCDRIIGLADGKIIENSDGK
jgi:putative ABC transport system ATP-binding protein